MNIAVISDIHWGDRSHMYRTRQDVFDKFAEYNVESLVINGDIVCGSGVYRKQEWEQILGLPQWQCAGAAYIVKDWLDKLKPQNIYVTKGQHDQYRDINLTEIFCDQLRLIGVKNVKYSDAELVLDGILFTHGYGYSSYYPISYAFIRNIQRRLLQLIGEGREIHRICVGHSHWLSTGYALSLFHSVDSTGGFQRNDRDVLGRTQRPVGGIIYCDGLPTTVKPDMDILLQDVNDKLLYEHNLQEISNIMLNLAS